MRWYWILLIALGVFVVGVFVLGWFMAGLDQGQSRGMQRRKL